MVMESQEPGADQCQGTPASMTESTQFTANPSIFIFPPEIRREVFRHLLVNRKSTIEPRTMVTVKGATFPRFPHSEIKLDILRTCRLIYEEASKVLYAENTVCFQCRWDIQGQCRTFDHLPMASNLKNIKHLQLEIYRWYGSSYLLPVYIESTLKRFEAFGCYLSTLRLKFTPTKKEVQPLAPNGSQTEAAVLEKIADQLCHFQIKQKIEFEFATSSYRKGEGERLQRFIDTIAAKKNWKSRKTTVVLVLGWGLGKGDDIGKGTLIDLPVPDFAADYVTTNPFPIFGIQYGENDKIAVNEHSIAQYKWKWLLQ